ncbi:hypothetical protein D9757_009404 [Collybiopsis confluens]|uniref:Rhodanese domain-containing protein n=1 Tax=Collybiopsis confluens TaxID=2823264 RepID=A0A8H5HDE3_9AGAR|nr:hypothetical protein D9757_009404 [Collybiopsis confluens]
MTSTTSANALPNLISAQELHSLLQVQDSSSSLRVIPLDVSLVYPPASEYTQHIEGRIPNAKFFSMMRYASEDPGLQTAIMLPTPGRFVGAMRYLGIRRNDHIVCYDVPGFWTPARGAWMLKVFGHEKVSILNGGLAAWKAAGYSVESGPYSAATPSEYPFVQRDENMIAPFETIKSFFSGGANNNNRVVIDTRPIEEYRDIGHIPNSFSLPFSYLLAGPPPNDMRLLPKDQWSEIIAKVVGEDLFKKMQDKNSGVEVINTCGWGVTTCTLWLVLGHLGVSAKVFDESWDGYELRVGNPVEKGAPGELRPAEPTKGVTSFPELQIPIENLPDDGTPKVEEVSH